MEADYKKAVGIFGLAIPLSFLLLLIVAVMVVKGRVSDTYQQRVQAYEQAKNIRRQVAQLEKTVSAQRAELDRWETLIASESRGSFLKHWKEAGKGFKGKEFQMDLPVWKNHSDGFGKGLKQSATQVSLIFDGSYRAMQIALMRVETQLPQMQLDQISMTPNKDGRTIQFKTTHTIWTKD